MCWDHRWNAQGNEKWCQKDSRMKGRRKDIREIWVEPEHQDAYKYRTLKDVSKRLKEMREILTYVERPQASQITI